MKAINPTTGTLIREYSEHAPDQVERMVKRAAETFRSWRCTPLAARAEGMRQAGRVLRAHVKEFASLMTDEMGKTLVSSEAEVEKCATCCDFFATNAEAFLAPEPVQTDAAKSYVRYEPLGVVLAIMPWNFPFWQAFRCAVPALMAGNTVLLKHASNVPGSALAIERVFREAGFPEGAFSTLLVPSSAVEHLIVHPAVQGVSLTGSEDTGVQVATHAGASLKKQVLELGGSDAFVVLADTDPAWAAREAAGARVINNGQSCIAAKRFIVADAIADAFEKALVDRMKTLKVGDPRQRDTDIGPLARGDLRQALHQQVEHSVQSGAKLLLGGRVPDGAGFFYPATVLARVTPGMAAFDEETFGPVAAVIRARDDDDAVALANRSRYGLGASVWTADPKRGEAVAQRLEAGLAFVNGIVRSDPRLPFGGVKRSGYGRELWRSGIREFVNVKTVWIGEPHAGRQEGGAGRTE